MPLFGSSDSALVRRTLRGQRESFRQLVERYGGVAHAVAYARLRSMDDAEDVAQEAFVLAFEKLDTLREPAKFGAWLTGIVRHRALRRWKVRTRQPELDAQAADHSPITPDMESRETRAHVRAAVDALEESLRETVLLYYFAGKTAKEVAVLLETTPAAVRKRLQRAREQIGAQLLATMGPDAAQEPARAKRIMAALPAGMPWATAEAATGFGLGTVLTWPTAVVGVVIVMGIVGVVLVGGMEEPPTEERAAVEAATEAVDLTQGDEREMAPTETHASRDAEVARSKPNSTTVYGVVIDDDGTPIGGARVEGGVLPHFMGRSRGIEARTSTTSDADGTFTMVYPKDDNDKLIAVQMETFAPGRYGYNRFLLGSMPFQAHRLELVVHERTALSGMVVDEDGAAISEATVTVRQFHARFPTRAHIIHDGMSVETNIDGTYRMDPALDGSYLVEVFREGFVSAMQSVESGREVEPIVMRRAPLIAGVLLASDTGAPVAGGVLRVAAERIGRTEWVETSTDGTFTLRTLGVGEHRLRLEHETYVLSESASLIHVDDNANAPLRVMATPGARIRGTVRDRESGDPIPNVAVWAEPPLPRDQWPEHFEATLPYGRTDAAGRYESPPLPPGAYRVRFGNSTAVPSIDPTDDVTFPVVELAAGEVRETPLDVLRAYDIEGVVVDERGAPVRGANLDIVTADVSATVSGAGRHGEWLTTNEGGRFHAYLASPSEAVYLTVKGPAHASRTMGPYAVNASTAHDITIEALPAASIMGRLLKDRETPSGALQLTVAGRPPEPEQPDSLPTGAVVSWGRPKGLSTTRYGWFFAGGLYPDTYTLAYEDRAQQIALKPGEMRKGIVFDIRTDSSGALTGRVTYNGESLGSVRVSVGNHSAHSTSDGLFHVPGDTDGEDTLTATLQTAIEGVALTRVIEGPVAAFQSPDGALDIAFGAGAATIEGHVTINGNPAFRSSVTIEPVDPSRAVETVEAVCSVDGAYIVPHLLPGAYLVRLPVYQTARTMDSGVVDIAEGQVAQHDFDVSVGTLVLTVTGLLPHERADVLVLLGSLEVGDLTVEAVEELNAHANAQSRFEREETKTLRGMPPGVYTVVAGAYNRTAETVSESLASMRVQEVVMEIAEGLTTEVAVDFSE